MSQVDLSQPKLESERDVLSAIRQVVPTLGAREIGIGDDAALVKVGDTWLVLTLDTMVEDVHFLVGQMASWSDIGWKATVANLSDLAAMGATPCHAMVGLTVKHDMSSSDITDLYTGIQDALSKFGGKMVGGDTVVSDRVSIAIAMIGMDVTPETVLRVDAAEAGDIVAVSGSLGDSRGGLEAILSGHALPGSTKSGLIEKHIRPMPRNDLTSDLVAHGIRCATDISDGLMKDLGEVCEASGLSAYIDLASVPMSSELKLAFPDQATEFALSGGEDYELLVIGRRDRVGAVNQSLSARSCAPLVVVGEMMEQVLPGDGVAVLGRVGLNGAYAQRTLANLENVGWDHWNPRAKGTSGRC